MEYLSHLNETQREAVKNYNGPSLVIAGAGSGKTRVLTYRIAVLLEKQVKAYRILALTFTNKAANEMKHRIGELVDPQSASNIWMGTFHSIFARILRMESDAIGFNSDFTIYDTQDSKNLIKRIIKDLKLDEKEYKPNEVLGRISMAKNNLVTSDVYQHKGTIREADDSIKKPRLYEIYKQYSSRCKKNNVMDFDDLLLYTNILFRDHPDILEKYQKRFEYILVDEYQDTNYAQYLIVKKLSQEHNNICVVGDDAQSIYSFRGAKIENILKFQSDYENCKVFKLEQNYRSTPTIVKAANSVIKKNIHQLEKTAYSVNKDGEKIQIRKTLTDREEAVNVAQEIEYLHNNLDEPYSSIGILYRTNSQSRILEETFRQYNIPNKIYGGLSFYQRKEVKDILAYLKLVVNPKDEESFNRVINYPKRGIGQTTLGKLNEYAKGFETNVWNILTDINEERFAFNQGTKNKLSKFHTLIQKFGEQIGTVSAYDIASTIVMESGIIEDLRSDKSPEGVSRAENAQELLNSIKEFTKIRTKEDRPFLLSNFMEEVSLLTDIEKKDTEDKDFVSLMTVHSAKGLEYKNVFIVGVEENLFPSLKTLQNNQSLEEERRLFYVAVTRAEKRLYISYSKSRMKWGNIEQCRPSRFIDEIDKQYINLPDDYDFKMKTTGGINQNRREGIKAANSKSTYIKKDTNRGLNMTPLSNDSKSNDIKTDIKQIGDLKIGNKVSHQRFGIGEIISFSGEGINSKAEVKFNKFGIKVLLLKFAKLKIIG